MYKLELYKKSDEHIQYTKFTIMYELELYKRIDEHTRFTKFRISSNSIFGLIYRIIKHYLAKIL